MLETKLSTNVSPPIANVYHPPRWLVGRHSQTIWPALIAPKPEVTYRRERWDTPDNDFIDIDFVDAQDPCPTLVLFHGLEGNSQSAYARALMAHAKRKKWRGLVAHFRGCSGENNRLMRAYHSGDSEHIGFVLKQIRTRFAGSPIYIAGVSLGGNAMLKWLGMSGSAASFINAAFAISPPHDLEAGAVVLSRGFNKKYTNNFLMTLKEKTREKAQRFPNELDLKAILAAKSFFEFDHLVTAPIHGFSSCYDYWRRSSCKQFMGDIAVPTVVLNALNDPFQPVHALAVPKQVSSNVRLEYPAQGGHVGFLQGSIPGHQQWLTNRVFSFFEQNR